MVGDPAGDGVVGGADLGIGAAVDGDGRRAAGRLDPPPAQLTQDGVDPVGDRGRDPAQVVRVAATGWAGSSFTVTS
jgi:hypothetical protein